MKINITTTNLDLTPSLKTFIDTKIGGIAKYLTRLDQGGSVALDLEVGRTTRHHRKGNVFRAEINLDLPKKVLRAVEEHTDVRAAIDVVRDKIRSEIEKYKTQHDPRRST